jgi:acetylxylan esterase
MAAVYPDMFAAASEFSGEPAGCFFTGTVRGWNSQCAGGTLHKSSAEWVSQVKAMYPGYSGQYPKMQVFHGDVDTTLNIASYNESIKEWSGLQGYSGNAMQTLNNNPGAKLTKYIYGDRLQGIWGHGIGHVVPTNETEALKWFGITVSYVAISLAYIPQHGNGMTNECTVMMKYASHQLCKYDKKRIDTQDVSLV